MGELAVIEKPALSVPEQQELSAWGDRKLDNAIQRSHSVAGTHMANYEIAATFTGVLLRERKARLGPRKFKPWVEESFNGSYATARRYVDMADAAVPILLTGEQDSEPAEDPSAATPPPTPEVLGTPTADAEIEEHFDALLKLITEWDPSSVDPHKPKECQKRVDAAQAVADFAVEYIAAHAAKLDQIPRAVPSEGGGFA